ncbi:dual specificity testis-specific protein kinase 2-like [Glandiceps talaboti]
MASRKEGNTEKFNTGRRIAAAPGSSCFALLSAVHKLAKWEDFDAEELGSGFFADVFKVRNHSNGDVMVVKIGKSTDRRDQCKLVKEIELMNKLNHPNVLKLKGACIKGGRLLPMLEYLSGGCLHDVLMNQCEKLPWMERVLFAGDIAKGMNYLHQNDIYHRDLTSWNCLLRLSADRRHAVVADFGLSRVDVDPALPPDSPRKMSMVGSAYWMAPEMMRGEVYNKKVDVFSYGITLCEVIARIEADPDELPRTNSFGLDVEHFRKKCEDCPCAFLALAERCCDLNPTNRPWFKDIVSIATGISASFVSLTDSKTNEKIINGGLITSEQTEEAGPSERSHSEDENKQIEINRNVQKFGETLPGLREHSLSDSDVQDFEMAVTKTKRKPSSLGQTQLPSISETDDSNT